MKKRDVPFLGLLVILPVFCITLTGCSDGHDSETNDYNSISVSSYNTAVWNQIRGTTWEKNTNISYPLTQRITFDDSVYSYSNNSIGAISWYSSSYSSYSSSSPIYHLGSRKIHFSGSSYYPFYNSYSFSYTLSGNTLYVTEWETPSGTSDSNMNGLYTKKDYY